MEQLLNLLPETKQFREVFRNAVANQNMIITASKTHDWSGSTAFFPPILREAYYRSWNNRVKMRTVTFFVQRDDANNLEKINNVLDETLVLLTLSGKIPYTKLLNLNANWKITSACVIL